MRRIVKGKIFGLGFTLIEMMIVVVIVAILAMIAIPSYRTYICRSESSHVKADLLLLAKNMERLYSENNFKYDKDLFLEKNTMFSPANGAVSNKAFDIELTVGADQDSYEFRATRVNNRCGEESYLLTNTGLKQKTINGSTENKWGAS